MSRYNDASRYVAQRRVSLLVRNLPLDCRAEEIRATFERFGEIRDVYLPRDYYTQRPKGFGFIEFRDSRDAEEALYQLDRSMMGGREITVVLSKENRKSPREMIKREDMYGGTGSGSGGGGGGGGGRSSGSYGRSYGGGGGGSYGGRRRSRSPDRDYRRRSPRRREGSYERRSSRERSYSRERSRSRSRSPVRDRAESPLPARRQSPIPEDAERSRDKVHERERFPEKDRSRSPARRDDDYSD